MKRILAPPALGRYPLVIGHGLLSHLGQLLARCLPPRPVAVVSDETVAALYSDPALASLTASGFSPFLYILPGPPGEGVKTLAVVAALYEQFLDGGLDRGGCVLALGGGSVGDAAGFAAATYLRGLPLVQVPTTLLSMADAGLGGKVGVNLPRGKNLVGAFKQPALVVADLETLGTLPLRELRAAWAEIVKTALVGDAALFAHLEHQGPEPLEEVVARCAGVKLTLAAGDPEDYGQRRLLNLGHTFAHALEICTAHRLIHGEAVAVGLAIAAELSCRLGLCPPELVERIVALLERMGLSSAFAGVTPEALLSAMAVDKKRQAGVLHFVLLREVGQACLVSADEIPPMALRAALEACGPGLVR